MSNGYALVPRGHERQFVAVSLGFSPDQPESWPSVVDDLIALKRYRGDEAYVEAAQEWLLAQRTGGGAPC